MHTLLVVLITVTVLSSALNTWYFATRALRTPRLRFGATLLALVCLGTLASQATCFSGTVEARRLAAEIVAAAGSAGITASIARHHIARLIRTNGGNR